MTDRPILYSGSMVRAMLADLKFQTRRLPKKRPGADLFYDGWTDNYVLDPGNADWRLSHVNIRVGDILYVRENWRTFVSLDDVKPVDIWQPGFGKGAGVWYEADSSGMALTAAGSRTYGPREDRAAFGKLRPGIHMPRHFSRLTLTVTDIRFERLQSISEEDALAEGIQRLGRFYGLPDWDWDDARLSAVEAYAMLWNSINGVNRDISWEANPWVVAYTFTVRKGNIDDAE